MNNTKYGLSLDGKLLGFNTSDNSTDSESVSVTYELDHFLDNVWLVDTAEHAEWVRLNSTAWYNAGYETPKNPYKSEKLKVVKVIQSVEEVSVNIPSFKEVMLFLDKQGNENGHSFFIDNPNYNQTYNLYQLEEYLRNKL